jgi:L-ascorbate metabolism protein UlaG (beta-lactamase superfamily)
MGGGVLLLLLCLACDPPLRRVPAIESPVGSADAVASGARATDHFATSSGDLALVPLEHASMLLVWHGLAVYVDPTSPTIDDKALPKADVVLVTDAHYDHLDPLALSHLRKAGTLVVGSPAAGARESLDVPLDVVMHEGETRTLPQGLEVTAVPAYNVARGAGPGMRYHERGQSVGYVLGFGGTRVYVSGDTECTPEVRALTNIDVALVSLNVPYAMTAAEATECLAAMHPRIAIAYASRHASPATLDRGALPGVEVRRREWYPLAAKTRARAYDAYAHGMWGLADDLLDEAQRLDPAGEQDFRVRWTRQWLKEAERPWPW